MASGKDATCSSRAAPRALTILEVALFWGMRNESPLGTLVPPTSEVSPDWKTFYFEEQLFGNLLFTWKTLRNPPYSLASALSTCILIKKGINKPLRGLKFSPLWWECSPAWGRRHETEVTTLGTPSTYGMFPFHGFLCTGRKWEQTMEKNYLAQHGNNHPDMFSESVLTRKKGSETILLRSAKRGSCDLLRLNPVDKNYFAEQRAQSGSGSTFCGIKDSIVLRRMYPVL